MKRIVLLDTETTGLVPGKHHCIEVAVVAYDLGARAPVEAFSSLIYSETNEAEAVNRIPVSLLATAPHADVVWDKVQAIVERNGEAMVAHNAAFDRGFVPAEATSGAPWICSKNDIEWPLSKLGDGLAYTALAHGVPVFTAHRAMADVETMVRLFQRVAEMGYDVPAMLERAARPKVRVVGRHRRDQNDLAKAHGFRWDPDVRVWWRNMPAEDVSGLPFQAEVSLAGGAT